MSNAGSPDVETRTVGARLIYFTSVFAHFTIFPLGDFLHILRMFAASTLPSPQVAAPEVPPEEEDDHGEERQPE